MMVKEEDNIEWLVFMAMWKQLIDEKYGKLKLVVGLLSRFQQNSFKTWEVGSIGQTWTSNAWVWSS